MKKANQSLSLIVILAVSFFIIAGLAWREFSFNATLLGLAVLSLTLGLRHGLDADHIAAIDTATRKLVQNGKQPLLTGLFFSIGHCLIVCVLCALIDLGASNLDTKNVGISNLANQFDSLKAFGDIAGTSISALFLFIMAGANYDVLRSLLQRAKQTSADAQVVSAPSVTHAPADAPLGFMARLLYPVFNLVHESWHMIFVGILFGLGFDTATEIALFGVSATQAASSLSFWDIMLFPALFAIAMTIVDCTNSLIMLALYRWALAQPLRRLRYNIALTSLSVVVAIGVGALEVGGLFQDKLSLTGTLWDMVALLNSDNVFTLIGLGIVISFLAIWLIAQMFQSQNKIATVSSS